MRKIGIALMVLGAVVLLGIVGESDRSDRKAVSAYYAGQSVLPVQEVAFADLAVGVGVSGFTMLVGFIFFEVAPRDSPSPKKRMRHSSRWDFFPFSYSNPVAAQHRVARRLTEHRAHRHQRHFTVG